MRGYRGLWHSLKPNYGIIVQRDILMNVLKEIDPEGTESTYMKEQIPVGTLMATVN